MAVFVVSYDIRAPGRDYQGLYDRLEEWKAVKVLESVWCIDWDTKASEIRDDLQKHIDANDALFIAKLVKQWAGSKMISGAADWLKSSSRSWE